MPDKCCRSCGEELKVKMLCRSGGGIVHVCTECDTHADSAHVECRLS